MACLYANPQVWQAMPCWYVNPLCYQPIKKIKKGINPIMVSKIKNKNEILQLNYIHQSIPKLNITRNNKGEK